jgi:BlaI family penicillinase repressor
MVQTQRSGARLTPLELRIMQVLWENGPCTVQAVQENLAGERFAYTTVQTMLNVLHRKGKVRRTLKGKAYEYQASLTQEKANRQAIGDLVDRMFDGSVEELVMNLVKARQLDPKRLERLKALIEEQETAERKKQVKNDRRS